MEKGKESKTAKNKPRKQGRPGKREQEKIKSTLWEYYAKGYSANYTALQTGHDWRTVQAYFKEWTEEIIDGTDFVAQQQEAKARLIMELDRRIETYLGQLGRIEKQIKKKPTVALENLLMQINRNLASLSLDKAGVLITPTVDIQITQILKDKYGVDIDELAKRARGE